MAVLTNSDYTVIKQAIQNDPTARGILRTWGISRSTLQALFQICEDWNTNGFAARPTRSYKAELDMTTTTTNQQAKMVWVVWSRWKAPQVI